MIWKHFSYIFTAIFNPKKKKPQTHKQALNTAPPLRATPPPPPPLKFALPHMREKIENFKSHLRLSLSVQVKSKNSLTKGGCLVFRSNFSEN